MMRDVLRDAFGNIYIYPQNEGKSTMHPFINMFPILMWWAPDWNLLETMFRQFPTNELTTEEQGLIIQSFLPKDNLNMAAPTPTP